jgi:hypothetical protein
MRIGSNPLIIASSCGNATLLFVPAALMHLTGPASIPFLRLERAKMVNAPQTGVNLVFPDNSL